MSNLLQIHKLFRTSSFKKETKTLIELLRWNKPTGRLILLLPAGWALWLAPNAPPSLGMTILIIAGTVFISGAGCIANDLWDQKIDQQVNRTKARPLAIGTVKTSTAWGLLCLMFFLSLLVVISLPVGSRVLCLQLSLLALPIIIIYPSTKRWFKYPQAILSICWGFSVLIPWAAIQQGIEPNLDLLSCWIGTMIWTFGFDTVYAMSDKNDDEILGINSSALSLKGEIIRPVSISYALTSLLIAISAFSANVNLFFWPFWLIATIGMQREILLLDLQSKSYGKHFSNQVKLGGLILFGLVLGRL
ncbi:4-hydroxybenzoate polyprenyltransferase [Prochlorococcus sp. MIT 1223]|uniref:4-hydroxybenzoate polyprenyltransferase n=1 Tax=Prochlorococcus sp. MIT 1223 TaxID=3096217 RepID=UPI002A74E007|nr:4-hydroxybenzoate polyprenyltransferase [Prochlorococcus sp. MIT 1223]